MPTYLFLKTISTPARSADQALWRAVLMQAIIDSRMRVTNKTTDAIVREARAWLLEPNEEFPLVCAFAGIDPDKLRTQLELLPLWWEEASNRLKWVLMPYRSAHKPRGASPSSPQYAQQRKTGLYHSGLHTRQRMYGGPRHWIRGLCMAAFRRGHPKPTAINQQ